ncbi:MAG TPA: VOC family protein [Longimicrobiaceae bacterium]|nr:VOC family protein [Longimicrobiaceae bacterium]
MRLVIASLLALSLALPAHAQLAPYNADGMTYGHVHVNVSDLDLHKRLWAEHFGAEIFERGPLTVAKFPSMLLILSNRAPTGGSQESVMDHFGFKVRDIEPFLERWRAAGYEVQSEFMGAEGFPNAYLMGPDSVRIELQEDPAQEEAVTGYHIHFFTDGYEDLMAWYVEHFGVEPFQRGTIATTANAPGMNLSFGGSRTERVPTRGRAIDHIGFEFADLESVVRRLEAKGVQFDVPLRDVPSIGLKIAFLTDPSGVYVELTQGLIDY